MGEGRAHADPSTGENISEVLRTGCDHKLFWGLGNVLISLEAHVGGGDHESAGRQQQDLCMAHCAASTKDYHIQTDTHAAGSSFSQSVLDDGEELAVMIGNRRTMGCPDR